MATPLELMRASNVRQLDTDQLRAWTDGFTSPASAERIAANVSDGKLPEDLLTLLVEHPSTMVRLVAARRGDVTSTQRLARLAVETDSDVVQALLRGGLDQADLEQLLQTQPEMIWNVARSIGDDPSISNELYVNIWTRASHAALEGRAQGALPTYGNTLLTKLAQEAYPGAQALMDPGVVLDGLETSTGIAIVLVACTDWTELWDKALERKGVPEVHRGITNALKQMEDSRNTVRRTANHSTNGTPRASTPNEERATLEWVERIRERLSDRAHPAWFPTQEGALLALAQASEPTISEWAKTETWGAHGPLTLGLLYNRAMGRAIWAALASNPNLGIGWLTRQGVHLAQETSTARDWIDAVATLTWQDPLALNQACAILRADETAAYPNWTPDHALIAQSAVLLEEAKEVPQEREVWELIMTLTDTRLLDKVPANTSLLNHRCASRWPELTSVRLLREAGWPPCPATTYLLDQLGRTANNLDGTALLADTLASKVNGSVENLIGSVNDILLHQGPGEAKDTGRARKVKAGPRTQTGTQPHH